MWSRYRTLAVRQLTALPNQDVGYNSPVECSTLEAGATKLTQSHAGKGATIARDLADHCYGLNGRDLVLAI